MNNHRAFFGMALAPQPVSGFTFTHLDVKDRLQHVIIIADILSPTTAPLKADEKKTVDKVFAGASLASESGWYHSLNTC